MIVDSSVVPHITTERMAESIPGTPHSENGQTVPHYEEREWPTKCISQITKMEVSGI